MKIIFVIDSMPKGGAERVIANLSNYLSKNPNNKIIVLTLISEECAYELNKEVEYDSINIKPGKKNIIQKLYHFFVNIGKLKKYFRNSKPDVVISFLPRASYYSSLSRNKNFKLIISERNNPSSIYKGKLKSAITKYLYLRADGLVFQTRDAMNYFGDKAIEKGTIIPNPVNDEFLVNPFIGKRNNNIINVGRLSDQKNQKLLIEAFNKFYKKHNNYKLYIYGDGPLRNDLEDLIKTYKLQKNVFLPGVSNDIKEKLFKSSFFVLSSNYEGMPNALMEAMALGVPSISTDCPCGGPRELINNLETGLLVDVNDVNSLAQAMELLASNRELKNKISENASEQMKNYSVEKINKRWKEYISSLGSDNNGK